MNDIFNEQLISKKKNGLDIVKQILIIIAAVLISFAIMFVPILSSFFLPIIIIEIFVVITLLKRFNIEYEYILTNSELDIDKIINKSKRKKMLSIDVKQFQEMIKVNSVEEYKRLPKADKILDYSSGIFNNNTYVSIYQESGKRIQLIFEPNDKIFNGIKRYIPSKIRK